MRLTGGIFLPDFSVLIATGVVLFQRPSQTSPNCPEPNFRTNFNELLSISHWSRVRCDNPSVTGFSIYLKTILNRDREYNLVESLCRKQSGKLRHYMLSTESNFGQLPIFSSFVLINSDPGKLKNQNWTWYGMSIMECVIMGKSPTCEIDWGEFGMDDCSVVWQVRCAVRDWNRKYLLNARTNKYLEDDPNLFYFCRDWQQRQHLISYKTQFFKSN